MNKELQRLFLSNYTPGLLPSQQPITAKQETREHPWSPKTELLRVHLVLYREKKNKIKL